MQNRISVHLPVDGLFFWKLTGREAISEAYSLTVTLLGTNARIDRSALLGKPLTISIPAQEMLTLRYINGKITRVAVSAIELSGTRYAVYTLTVEPDLWPMKRDRNLRIFQEKTVPQIVTSLLNEFHINVENTLINHYRIWNYCVQYQENSFDFISRLLEQEGIAYYFRHDKSTHTLVLIDAPEHYQPMKGYETIPYHQTPSGGSTQEEGIGLLTLEDNVTPGIYSIDDYDFRKPNAWLFQARQNPSSPQPGSIDVYDWPGRFVEHGHGEFYARIRQERWKVEHQQIRGTGTALGLAPGHTFILNNAPFFSDNGEYLTTAVEYDLEENSYASSNTTHTIHKIDFTVIPASVTFRPQAVSPWPRTYGPQTAKVVGPQGESIWTDKYGRVKVKFHWDRHAKGDDTSSCWVRVSSAWAGQGYGGVQIPRVGDEVVVDFINGDPDRPIITGRVYNEGSMPPWSLPQDSTRMGFMTRSKDGNKDNASYLFFEDSLGNESVELHSEKDMHVSVENNATVAIGGNLNTTIDKTQTETVTGDASLNYQSKRTTTVDKGDITTITQGRKLTITDGGDTRVITGDVSADIEGTVTTAIKKGSQSTTIVNGDRSIQVQSGSQSIIIQNGDNLTVNSGGQTQRIHGGVNTEIAGGWVQKITTGDIQISTPDQITLQSDKKIDLQCPDYFEYKSAAMSVKLNEVAFGLSEIGIKGFKYETAPVEIKFRGGGARLEVRGNKIERNLLSIKTALLNIIT